jgi:hypothetical protein
MQLASEPCYCLLRPLFRQRLAITNISYIYMTFHIQHLCHRRTTRGRLLLRRILSPVIVLEFPSDELLLEPEQQIRKMFPIAIWVMGSVARLDDLLYANGTGLLLSSLCLELKSFCI